MAKSKAKATESGGAKRRPLPVDGAALASQIARLDDELVRLVQERAKLAIAAAEHAGPPAPARSALGLDEESLLRLAAARQGPLPPRCVEAVLREVQSGCRSLIRVPRIAFLGPLYSFSHLAAIHRFGQSVEYRARRNHRSGVRGSPPEAVGFRAGAG